VAARSIPQSASPRDSVAGQQSAAATFAPRESSSANALDEELYRRGIATAIASWEAYAAGSPGAVLIRRPGVAVARFPSEPERAVYNNAVVERELTSSQRADALDEIEAAYASAGVTRFAVWAHESDRALQAALEERRYALDGSTRAMAMRLSDIRLPRPAVALAPPELSEHMRIAGAPPRLLEGVDRTQFHLLVARLEEESVATAVAFDLGGDSGIFNVSTLEHARRRGLGTAVTTLQAYAALDRGCRTASLQSTKSAERMYAAVGFRDLGTILEYVPCG
jgi:hypothetical protein